MLLEMHRQASSTGALSRLMSLAVVTKFNQASYIHSIAKAQTGAAEFLLSQAVWHVHASFWEVKSAQSEAQDCTSKDLMPWFHNLVVPA